LDQPYEGQRKSSAGRKPIDPLILFKMLIFQQLFKFNDTELEFQVSILYLFAKLIGVGYILMPFPMPNCYRFSRALTQGRVG
jgi:hypothetical protein